ncbi:MAG: glycosyltransferase, partial [Verrucomicrobia bacterium]|nr:glycosyltransferase [Verrucomicrobiota bacterium]
MTTPAPHPIQQASSAPPVVHLFGHKFGRGAGVEQYGLGLATALSQGGWKVFFHARKADVELAAAAGVTLKLHAVARFPRKLQDFRFFRLVSRLAPALSGVQLALTRVPVRDGVICGGTHRGYLKHGRKLTGPFDWLQIWMETQAYRKARHIVSSSFLCQRELVQMYHLPESRILVLHPAVQAGKEFVP